MPQTITLATIARRRRYSRILARVAFLRQWADELRERGDCDGCNEARRLDCEADDLEAIL